MKELIDLSAVEDAAYKLADLINGQNYGSILYYEFHEPESPNEFICDSERLQGYVEYSSELYNSFISSFTPDEFEAKIHVVVKLGDVWLLSYNISANYYHGFGPQGLFQLRKACKENNVIMIARDDNFDSWLNANFEHPIDEASQFEKIIRIMRSAKIQMQRTPKSFSDLNEETLRDKIMTMLAPSINVKVTGETFNKKGKTDILIPTIDGFNDFIFELKFWKGIKSLERTIEQLFGYLSYHNNRCGIILFSRNKEFGKIVEAINQYVDCNFDKNKNESENSSEIRFFALNNTVDRGRVEVHISIVNLNS